MLTHPEIWAIMQNRLQRGEWITLQEINELMERHGNLDDDDFEPQAPNSDIPKWKRNVRNVLQYRKGKGDIRWDGDARYLLP